MKADLTLTIARPVDEVWAYLSNPENTLEWQSATREIRLRDRSHYTQVLEIVGRRIESEVEITASEAPRRFAIRSTGGAMTFSVEHELEPAEGGTRLRVRGEGQGRGVLRFAGAALGPAFERQVRDQFEKLKAILESR